VFKKAYDKFVSVSSFLYAAPCLLVSAGSLVLLVALPFSQEPKDGVWGLVGFLVLVLAATGTLSYIFVKQGITKWKKRY
jgi:hypothetical protein